MENLLWIPALSFGSCLALTPLVRTLALRCGLVDRPDARRKLHARAIPVAGGCAILVSVSIALALWLMTASPSPHLGDPEVRRLAGVLLAALVVCGLGVADDFVCLRGRHKLLGQLAAVGIVVACGVEVRTVSLFTKDIELGLLSVPFTAFFLLGAINSMNLIDGMDGLLSSVALIACSALAVVAVWNNQASTACLALALAGALVAFLRYNFPPATIFLGDAGSMVVGLVVGVLALESFRTAPATVPLMAPVALLILPIFDTTAALLRRKLTGRSLYSPDRGHLHHCLLRSGLSPRRVLLVVVALSLVTAVGVLAGLAFRNEVLALLSALAVVSSLVLTRLFGHVELELLQMRFYRLIRSLVVLPSSGEVADQEKVRLQGSIDWEELWSRLTDCAARLRLSSVRLNVNAPALHECYHARWDRHIAEEKEDLLWRAEFPLRTEGQAIGRLEVTGQGDATPVVSQVGAVVGVAREVEAVVSSLASVRWAESISAQAQGPHPAPEVSRRSAILTGSHAHQPV